MYISKVAFSRPIEDRYQVHQKIWTLFGDKEDRKRDFLYYQTGRASALVVSQRVPVQNDVIKEIVVKPYAPNLKAGASINFIMRVNPTSCHVHKRIDFISYAHSQGQWLTYSEIEEKLVKPWLEQRVSDALDIKQISISSYKNALKFRKPGVKPIIVSQLDLTGQAQIKDVAALEKLLFNGIGHARAFGLGLMLVTKSS